MGNKNDIEEIDESVEEYGNTDYHCPDCGSYDVKAYFDTENGEMAHCRDCGHEWCI